MSQNRLTTTGDRRTTTTGDVRVQAGTSEGELAQILDTLTLSSAGMADVGGAVAATLDTLVLASTGTLEIVGQASPTLDALTSAATGTVDLVGLVSITLDALAVAATAGVEVQGVSGAIFDAVTLVAAGTAGDPVIIGDLDQALAPLTLAVMDGYQAAVLSDGPTAYWRLNEPSGLTATDVVGGAVGVIAGGVTLGQAGAISDGDPAMLFNGSTGRITVPDGTYHNFSTGPMTVEFWFKTTTSADDYAVDNKAATSAAPGFAAQAGAAANQVVFRISDGTTQATCTSQGVYGNGAWHHFVGVLTRGATDVLTVYVDGMLVKTTNVPSAGWDITPSRALAIGAFSGASSPSTTHYDGSLDEIALYNIALTESQIATHYLLGLQPHGTVAVSGDVAVTLSGLISLESGYLEPLTVVAEATIPVVGDLGATLDAMTGSADGVLAIDGAADITLQPLSTSLWVEEGAWLQLDWVDQVDVVTGTVDVAGALSATLADASLVADGAVADPGTIVGDLDRTLDALGLVSTGVVEAAEIRGDLDVTLDALTMASASTVEVAGTADVTLAPVVVVAFSAFQPVARPGDRFTTSLRASRTTATLSSSEASASMGSSRTTTTLVSSETAAEFKEAA